MRLIETAGLESAAYDSLAANGRINSHASDEKAVDLARDFPLTEIGSAEAFVSLHGRDVRYDHTVKRWRTWNKCCWADDDLAEVDRRAKGTIRAIHEAGLYVEDKALRDAVIKFALRSDSDRGVRHLLSRAAAELPIASRAAGYDRDAWLLNPQSATLDLRTGQLHPHRREDLITRVLPVAYDPGALCPRWEQFIGEVFEPHPDVATFIQRAIGYPLTGDNREECLFLMVGSGRNGKGTLLSTIAALLGEYAGTADFSTFVGRNDSGPRDDIANMRGRRFVSAQEGREGAALAESLLKWLTGGDSVRARRLYENSVEFLPTWKIWLATNHRPTIHGTDPAIWSRIRLVPFDVSFVGREDRGLKTALLDELPGILRWAVEGCRDWQADGLGTPRAVTDATAAYRAENDQIGRFLDERCVRGDRFTVRARVLYSAYRGWATGVGEEAVTETAFGLRLTERSIPKKRKDIGNVYESIALDSQRGPSE